MDQGHLRRTTLLEGVPFEKELAALPFPTKKFEGLFRDSKISFYGAPPTYAPGAFVAPKTYNIVAGLPTRLPPPVRPLSQGLGLANSPLPAATAPARSHSVSTIASEGPSRSHTPFTWAAKAAAPPPPVTEPPVPKAAPKTMEPVVSRNRAGQRVDSPGREYNKPEVDRIKRMKLCNVHYLLGNCPYGINCPHDHEYNASPGDIATLRLVARMAPCLNGTVCDDPKCIYGHRCPAPGKKTKVLPGKKPCIFGEECKFPLVLHNIDEKVVKTTTIR